MFDEKYVMLINKKIDGQLSAAEEDLLTSYLDKDQSAKQYYDDLKQSMHILDNLEEINAPDNLKNNIMNTVDRSLYAPKNSLKLDNFSWSLLFKPTARISLAFAAGLLIGIFMLSLYQNDSTLNNQDIYGTIGLTDKDHFIILNQTPLQSAEAAGLLTIKKTSSVYIADIDLQNMFVGEFTIEYDPAKFVFYGYQNYDHSSSRLENSRGLLRLSISGKNRSQLQLKEISAANSSIKFQIKTAQKVIFSETIELKANN